MPLIPGPTAPGPAGRMAAKQDRAACAHRHAAEFTPHRDLMVVLRRILRSCAALEEGAGNLWKRRIT